MAFLGNVLMKPRAMLTAVHTFLEDEAELIMPLSLLIQEEQPVMKHVADAEVRSNQHDRPEQIYYDSETPDDCMCAGTCS